MDPCQRQAGMTMGENCGNDGCGLGTEGMMLGGAFLANKLET